MPSAFVSPRPAGPAVVRLQSPPCSVVPDEPSAPRRPRLRRRIARVMLGLACAAFLAASARPAAADEWNQYRGPRHDGSSAETGIAKAWAASAAQAALEGPHRRRLRHLRRRRQAGVRVRRPQGARRSASRWTPTPARSSGPSASTRPSPTARAAATPEPPPPLDGDRVYLLSTFMKFACLNAADGKVVWQHDLAEEDRAQKIHWGNAGSPILDGDKIFIGGGGPGKSLMAFDKNTGKIVWAVGSEELTQASPVPCTIHGVRQVIFFMHSGLVSRDARQRPGAVAVPVHVRRRHRRQPGRRRQGRRHRLRHQRLQRRRRRLPGREERRQLHRHRGLAHQGRQGRRQRHHLVHPRLLRRLPLRPVGPEAVQDRPAPLRGHDHRQGGLVQARLRLRRRRRSWWTSTSWSKATPATIALVEATPEGYKEVGRLPSIGEKCWSAAILADGRIYARNKTEGFCFEVNGK